MARVTKRDAKPGETFFGREAGIIIRSPVAFNTTSGEAAEQGCPAHLSGHPLVSGGVLRMSLKEYIAYAEKAHGDAPDDVRWSVFVQGMLMARSMAMGEEEKAAFDEKLMEVGSFPAVPFPFETLERARTIAFEGGEDFDIVMSSTKLPRFIFDADAGGRDAAKRGEAAVKRMGAMRRAGRAQAEAKAAADAKPETILGWVTAAARWINNRPHTLAAAAILAIAYVPFFDDEPLAYKAGEIIANATDELIGIAVLATPLIAAITLLIRGRRRRRPEA